MYFLSKEITWKFIWAGAHEGLGAILLFPWCLPYHWHSGRLKPRFSIFYIHMWLENRQDMRERLLCSVTHGDMCSPLMTCPTPTWNEKVLFESWVLWGRNNNQTLTSSVFTPLSWYYKFSADYNSRKTLCARKTLPPICKYYIYQDTSTTLHSQQTNLQHTVQCELNNVYAESSNHSVLTEAGLETRVEPSS